MKRMLLSLCWVFAAHAQPGLAEEPGAKQAAAADAPVRLFKRCYGGLEDGKIVVREDELANELRQTTHRRCRIDGGGARRAPQSPSIAASRVTVA